MHAGVKVLIVHFSNYMSFIQLKYVLYITSKYEIEKKTITFFKHLPTSTSSFASLGIIYEYVHNKYGGGGGGGGGGGNEQQ